MRINKEVLQILERCEVNGNELTLPEQLPRNVYVQVDKVLKAAGATWNKKTKTHVFEADAEERVEQMLINESIEVAKDDFDYFPTPQDLVQKMLEAAGNLKGKTVLEPSAGQGAISQAAASAGAEVTCYELSPQNFAALQEHKVYKSLIHVDFLATVPAPVFDVVLMNPPFSKQADIKHVQHAWQYVKQGGKLVAIMASSVTFRNNNLTANFRDMVDKYGEIIPLPPNSFKSSGTGVNTVMVVMENRPNV